MLFFKLELNLRRAKPLRCIEPQCQCLEVGQQCFEWFWRRPEPLFVDLLYFGHGLNKNISTKHLAQPSESHVVLNGLCLLHGWSCNGRCNSEQMGWGLGEWVGGGGGGGGGVLFCGSAGEPGSQSGRWRNHLPTTSLHPPHTPDAPSTCDNSYNKSAYEKNLMAPSLLFFQTCKEDSVPCRKQEIPDKLVYIRACDPESMHSRTRKQNEAPSSTIGNNGLSARIQTCVLDLLTPVYMLTLALKCNTSQQLEMGLLCLSSRMTGTWKWNTNK